MWKGGDREGGVRLARTAAAMLVAGTIPASADWQFTWWGMSPAELIAAGRGTVRQPRGEDFSHGRAHPYQLSAAGDFWIADVPVVGSFHFRDARLAMIVFAPAGTAENCRRLQEAMTRAYGAPLTADRGDLFDNVTWKAGSDTLRYVRTGEPAAPVCSVTYSPGG